MYIEFRWLVFGVATAAMLFVGSVSRAEVSIDGAGASFPYPLYAKWAESYRAKTGVEVNYRATGSGDGVRQIASRLVDFGASDIPLSPVKLDKEGLLQFPSVIGGVVPVVNIQGVAPGRLKLDAATLVGIYLGKITQWNDPALAALNGGLELPDAKIAAAHFSETSGTTFIFTSYLSSASAEWKRGVGAGAMVPWKVGASVKRNDDMAAYVQGTENSIGYLEYTYALKNHLSHVQVRNRDGAFVSPGAASFRAAAAAAKWEDVRDFYEMLIDEPGRDSWPICGATYILIREVQEDAAAGRDVLKFFDWAYASGGKQAVELGYVPLPDRVQNLVRVAWREQLRNRSGLSFFK